EDKAILMVRGVASVLEKHHRVQVLDEALEAAVRLSHRYIPARQLPDKAVSLLDTVCARVAISQHAVPAQLDDCLRAIESLQTELEIIGREAAVGMNVTERQQNATEKLTARETQRAELELRWKEERDLVDRILAIRAQLRKGNEKVEGTGSQLEQAAQVQKQAAAGVAVVDPPPPALSPENREKLLAELGELQQKLTALQGESPLILPSVDEQAVASVVQDWTGVPVGRMVKNEIETVLKLADTLNQRVIGQRHGLEIIARRIQTSRAKLDNPNKPIGVFLLCGPSGVGKTETALTLAEALYGGEQNVITINMSEFQEAHTVSTLKGSPPGYVGYGEGGVLTEAVRRRPYSVVLLDEVEKAHPDVHELFFQVFDKGWMEDGEGRDIDFRNTIILLTSNVGTDLIMSMTRDPELMPSPEGIGKALREPLLKVFPAALLGRLVVIPYYPLSDDMLGNIVRLQLNRISKRVTEHHRIPFTYVDEAVKLIVSRCTEVESGGRMIDAILTNTVLPEVSREFLTRTMAGQTLNGVRLGVANNDFDYQFD
ncbi:MAG TPA: AAA family ATPase, partial [Sphingomicrobium sp.]